MNKKITEAVEAEKAAIIGMLTGMQTSIDIALRGAVSADDATLRFASGFVGVISESIEGDLHRVATIPPKSSIILP